MKCYNHPERDATATCASCGRPLCSYCQAMLEGEAHCPTCVDKTVARAAAAERASRIKPPAAASAKVDSAHRASASEGYKLLKYSLIPLMLSGALVLIGLFLPWFGFSSTPFEPVSQWMSGWSITEYNNTPYTILVCSICIILFSASAFIIDRRRGSMEALQFLCVLTIIASAISAIASLVNWMILEDSISFMLFGEYGAGQYIAAIFSTTALLSALTASFAAWTKARLSR
ncbi:MAG: hypothetical protein U9N44_01585 [Chloroflexota bacterium]|nr:hypothetical protein [Chloroflexota bacterium]